MQSPFKIPFTSFFLLLLYPCLFCSCLHASGIPSQRVITKASEVKALSAEDADKPIRVHLRGVFIGSADPPDLAFVMHDGEDSVYVISWAARVDHLRLGDVVDVEGVTRAGGYAPDVRAESIRVVGRGEIPEPIPVTIDSIYLGRDSSRWLTFSGIVRSAEVVKPGDPHYYKSQVGSVIMEIASGNSRIPVEVKEPIDPLKYIDTELQVNGICFEWFDANRHFVKPFILVPKGIKPVILKSAPENPYKEPLLSFFNLLTFQNRPKFGRHRVHFQGTVLYHQLGQVLWLRNGEYSLKVETRQDEQLIAGDKVDVLGFPKPGQYNPMLEDAVFRKMDDFQVARPIIVKNLDEAFKYDENLIQITGVLSSLRRFPNRTELILNWNGISVKTILSVDEDYVIPSNWKLGSLVDVSGICIVESDSAVPFSGAWIPKTFQVLLRSENDLSILKSPPWWNSEHIAWILSGVLIIALLMIIILVWYSNWRFKEQEHQRAMAEAEFSAILKERNRLAREIHDTLSQSLGAISVHLELARMKSNEMTEKARKNIGVAHQLVRDALTDARNSIWNMRSQILNECDLAEALERVLKKLVDESLIECKISVEGDIRRLSPVVENNLFKIGQEAITNAVKYANPSFIEVFLAFEENRIQMKITDDGIGIVAAKNKSRGRKSFGLLGIRERVDLIGGTLNINSIVDEGTSIEVSVPVSSS